MDAKYLGKALALPKDVADALEAKRVQLSASVGCKLSLSQTVGYLVKFHSDRDRELVESRVTL